MVDSFLLLNSGDYVLLNIGDKILLNGAVPTPTGVVIEGQHAVADLRGIGADKKKKRIRLHEFESTGRISRVKTFAATARIQKLTEMSATAKITRLFEGIATAKLTRLNTRIAEGLVYTRKTPKPTTQEEISDKLDNLDSKMNAHYKSLKEKDYTNRKLKDIRELYDMYKDMDE